MRHKSAILSLSSPGPHLCGPGSSTSVEAPGGHMLFYCRLTTKNRLAYHGSECIEVTGCPTNAYGPYRQIPDRLRVSTGTPMSSLSSSLSIPWCYSNYVYKPCLTCMFYNYRSCRISLNCSTQYSGNVENEGAEYILIDAPFGRTSKVLYISLPAWQLMNTPFLKPHLLWSARPQVRRVNWCKLLRLFGA